MECNDCGSKIDNELSDYRCLECHSRHLELNREYYDRKREEVKERKRNFKHKLKEQGRCLDCGGSFDREGIYCKGCNKDRNLRDYKKSVKSMSSIDFGVKLRNLLR